jgi:hypothetical protein
MSKPSGLRSNGNGHRQDQDPPEEEQQTRFRGDNPGEGQKLLEKARPLQSVIIASNLPKNTGSLKGKHGLMTNRLESPQLESSPIFADSANLNIPKPKPEANIAGPSDDNAYPHSAVHALIAALELFSDGKMVEASNALSALCIQRSI